MIHLLDIYMIAVEEISFFRYGRILCAHLFWYGSILCDLGYAISSLWVGL